MKMDHGQKNHVHPLFRLSEIKTSDTLSFKKPLTLFELSSGSPEPPINTKRQIESLRALLPFVLLFRSLGLIPIQISKSYTNVTYNKYSVFRVITIIGAITQIFLLGEALKVFAYIAAQVNTDSIKVVDNALTIVYYGHVFSITFIMFKKAKLLPDFFEACENVEKMCLKYDPQSNEKSNLVKVKTTWAIFGIIFSAQMFGEVLYYNRVANGGNVTLNVNEFLANLDSTSLLPTVVDSKVIGILTLIAELYCDLEWTFGEHLICAVAFILTCYFSRLNHGILNSVVRSASDIEQLRRDHRLLKDLVEQYNSIFSPILLVTYVGNLGYLLGRLYVGVGKDLKESNRAVLGESFYAFFFLVAKIFFPTWFGAIMNETAHESLDTVHDWSSSIETEDCKYRIMVINRFVSQLVTDPVHMNGSGYFTLTKTFIVTLISGIIGYEVIILQFQQAAGLA